MLAQFGLAKGIGGAAGKTETSEDHWKTIDSLKPWAGGSSVSLRQRSGSPARYSTGSGAHDGSVWPRDTQGVSRANTSGGGRSHRHWGARPVPQG